MAAGFFRGTSFEQDARFSNKWKKLLSSTKFPEIYSQPVETKLVQLDSIRTWVARKLQQLLGFEDEVVVDFVLSFLETYEIPDPRELHLNMSGFLEDKTFTFMQELWNLLLEAQKEAKVVEGKVVSAGVPPSLVEELRTQLEEKQRVKEAVEERLKQRVQNSSLDDIEPSKLPSEVEQEGPMEMPKRFSDSEGSSAYRVENARSDSEGSRLGRRHNRSRRRRRSLSRERVRRRERTPLKHHRRRHHRHHRHHHHGRSSRSHRLEERELKDESHKESYSRSSLNMSPGSEKSGEELHQLGTIESFETKAGSGKTEEQVKVTKESSVDNNSRESLLAELARVEREAELRRKALESMHQQRK